MSLLQGKTKTQRVFLNSKYAYTYNNGNFHSDVTFLLNNPITRPKDHVMSVKLETLVFPYSVFTVDTNTDTLNVVFEDTSTKTYTFETQNYTAYELADYLKSEMADKGFSDVKYLENYGSFWFKHSTQNFTFLSTSTCLKVLGFTEGINHVSGTDDDKELLSDSIVNLEGDSVLYFDIQNLNTNNYNTGTGQRSTFIKAVPLITAPLDTLFYESKAQDDYTYLQEDLITSLRIRLIGEDQVTPIELTRTHWNCCLLFSFTPV